MASPINQPRPEVVSLDTLRTVAQNLRMRYPGTMTAAEAEAIARRGIEQSPGFIAPPGPNSASILAPQLRTRGTLSDFEAKRGIFSPTGK